jgi:hypothetical protein
MWRFRRFSQERNTIQMRFTNPRFMHELMEASHTAEAVVAPISLMAGA